MDEELKTSSSNKISIACVLQLILIDLKNTIHIQIHEK